MGARRARTVVGLALMAGVLVLPSPVLGQDGQDEDTRGLIEAEVEVESPDDATLELEATLEDAAGNVVGGSGSRVEGQTYNLVLDDPGPEWAVTDIDCFSVGEAASTWVADTESRSVLIDLAPIDYVSCSFTVSSGIVEFLLRVEPEDEEPPVTATITRSTDGAVEEASSAELRGGHQVRFPPGTHTATLSDPGEDWHVTEALCIDLGSDVTLSSGDVGARLGSAGVDAGELVQCDFRIEKGGRVTIETRTEPEGLEQDFTYTVWGEGQDDGLLYRGTPPANSTTLPPGAGAIELTEVEERWKVVGVDCRERDETLLSIGDETAGAAGLGVDPGDDITCVFRLQDQTVPRQGPWRVVETSNRLRCRNPAVADAVDLSRSAPEDLRLRVRDKGQRITAGGVRLRRASEAEGIYRGRSNRARAEWRVISPQLMRGTNTLGLRAGCAVIRNFRMSYQGD